MECSSCSAAERPFAGFLARSLDSLRRELPWIFARLCARLAPRELRVEVDGEVLGLCCEPGDIRLIEAPAAPAVEARTDRQAILDLVGARVTLRDALLEERLRVRGALEDVIAFHDGLLIYVHGAVRDPAFPALLRRYRRAAPRDIEGAPAGALVEQGRGR